MHYRTLAGICLALLVAAPVASLASGDRGAALTVLQPRGARTPEIESFKVRTTILPGFSITRVEQVFRNRENRMLEARYRFPIPWRAAVSDFSMWVNGKEVRGEVVERKKARRIYESIVNKRRDPGLLEVHSHRYFSLRVYPIPPRGKLRFQISYVQPIDEDAGYCTYVFPLATNARESNFTAEQFSIQVDIGVGVPLAEAYAASHRDLTAAVRYGDKLYRFSMEQQKVALDRDFVLVYRLAQQRTGISLMAAREGGKPGYFFAALTPGKDLPVQPRPVDYIFLLDTSGSMRQGNLLPAGREAIRWFLDRISPESRFGIVAFHVAPRSFAQQLVKPTPETRKRAIAWLGELQARGGTDLLPALREAMRLARQGDGDRKVAIVVISDGRVSGAEARLDRYTVLLKQAGGVRVFSLGLGNDVNRPLLDALARHTGGFTRYLSSADDIRRGLVSLKQKISAPAMTDVTLRIEGGGVTELAPRKLPVLFAGSQLVVAGRYAKPGKVTLIFEGQVDGQPVRFERTVVLPRKDTDQPELERGWAAFRVRDLMIEIGQQGQQPALVKQVTELGLEYGLVTPYTSYLVLESEAEYRRYGIGDATRKRVARERAAQARRETRMAQQRDGSRPVEFDQSRRVSPRPSRSSGGGGFGGGSPTLLYLLALISLLGIRLTRRR